MKTTIQKENTTNLQFKDLTDVETQIIYLIRNLKLFDRLEIKYSKQGELNWLLVQSHTGVFIIPLDKL